MNEKAPICPSCNHTQGDVEATFCAKCRFPLMLIAGKYQLIQKLGEGGFGYVYLARHIRLQKEAERVVKIIKPEIFAQDPSIALRFEREVQTTSLLSQKCQHIVRIHDDFGVIPSLGHFYVMEYLQGNSVSAFLKDPHKLPSIAWCVHVFSQLCDAMRRAHDDGIIHRDLKPDNLMLIHYGDEPNFLKVLDFGIAKPLEDQGEALITQGFVGTPVYMAPELFSEEESADYRVDIYAMAIILYEMLTGQPPFHAEGHARTSFFKMLNSHLREAPSSLRALRPDRNIPEALEQVVLKGLSKDPQDRYASARDFKQAVHNAVGSSAISATPNRLSANLPSLDFPSHNPISGEVVLDNLRSASLTPHSSEILPSGSASVPSGLFTADHVHTPAQVQEATKVAPSPWKSSVAENNNATPLPLQLPLATPPSHAHTPLPLRPLAPAPVDPSGTTHIPHKRKRSVASQDATPQLAPVASERVSQQFPSKPPRSKIQTLAFSLLGVMGGLALGGLMIWFFQTTSTHSTSVRPALPPKKRLPALHHLPALPKPPKRRSSIPIYVPSFPTPKPQNKKLQPTPQPTIKRLSKNVSNRNTRRFRRSARMQRGRSIRILACRRPPKGMGWSSIHLEPTKTQVRITQGTGRIQRIRGQRAVCLWFRGHRVHVQLTARSHVTCAFWIYRLHRRVRARLKRARGTANMAEHYCRKL